MALRFLFLETLVFILEGLDGSRGYQGQGRAKLGGVGEGRGVGRFWGGEEGDWILFLFPCGGI